MADVDLPAGGGAGRPVLLAWELGGGMGHVQRLLCVARELARHGHAPVLALKNVVESWPLLRDTPFPVLQAPFWHPRPWTGARPFVAASYADILAIRGYTAVEDLLPMVQAWQALLDQVWPRLIVGDSIPMLCLAAYGTIPVVLLGDNFGLPPTEGASFPALVPGAEPVAPPEQLLAVIGEVQRRRGRPAPETLTGLLKAAARFPAGVPELDPYQSTRREPCVGPLHELVGPLAPPAQPRFFAYLAADVPVTERVLTALARSECPGSAYLRGASLGMRERFRKQGFDILETPAPIADVLPHASVVVHHASSSLAHDALFAGRPQLVFPGHLENILNAQLLGRLGVGTYLLGQFSEEQVRQALHALLTERHYMERAQALAQSLRGRGPWRALPRIVERCLALLAAA